MSKQAGCGRISCSEEQSVWSSPHDLLITYPPEPMTMWPISTRVNKPENDDPSLLDRTGDPFDLWAPLKSDGRA